MKKQILSLVMAGALVLSAGSVVSAADVEISTPEPSAGVYASEVETTGEVKVPTISITLSDTAGKKVGLNPYGLKYSIDGLDDATDAIVTKVETITNGSDVPITVNATTSASTESKDVKFATAKLTGKETTKSVFAYLQIGVGTTVEEKEYKSTNADQLVFGTKDTTKKAMVTLGDKDAADDKNKAAYKIFGGVASAPAKAWTSDDAVDFKIVYQFEPQVAPAAPAATPAP